MAAKAIDMQHNPNLPPIPPFITEEFTLKILLDLGGKATLEQVRNHVRSNYSGWTERTLEYLPQSLAQLRSGRYVDAKANIRSYTDRKLVFSIKDEVKPIIAASR